jgi:hypothetical protein
MVDQALQAATRPLDASCQQITLVSGDMPPILQVTKRERAILLQPLTLPLPKGEWVPAIVRFVRVNKETGRSLFYFDDCQRPAQGALYGRIVDPSVKLAGNAYARAFADDQPLDVWVRQRAAERGRLNLLWEITAKPPDDATLF